MAPPLYTYDIDDTYGLWCCFMILPLLSIIENPEPAATRNHSQTNSTGAQVEHDERQQVNSF